VRGVIFDRDGTLIKYKPYLHKVEDVELINGVRECLEELIENDILIFLHTNQSGVGRGYFTLDDVEKVNNEMLSQIGLDNLQFQEVCIATDLDESENSLRKPSPKFARYLMDKYNIPCQNLYMVGDNISDIHTAISANCISIWFSSEWSIKSEDSNVSYSKLNCVDNYKDLTNIILGHRGN